MWFSLCTPVSSTNKTDHHGKTEIMLKVALNTITHLLLSVADLMVFVVLETLESVVPSSVDKYPKVRDHSIKIGVNSNIARHVANRPKTSF
jgi:hypothetical protein